MDSSKNQKTDQQKSSGEKEFSIQPVTEGADPKFAPFQANPGPAIHKDLNVPEEGTKEERRAKAAEWNKKQ
ncbi:uncharacterized protein DNG_02914 [Cephalotrichum gorgonifer]|uniref:Uncharacterized protein n=1 Tax=Cephalotrichum gorgonifer TaxID=2041049 RepID=A0AAE8MV88_9PEZI|nr:uncharacterized protein DNG_02914 [Cephalotrichum gorgonifer]